MQALQQLLNLWTGEHLVLGDLLAAADRDEQEEVGRYRADSLGQQQDVRDLIRVVPRDGAVHLRRHALLSEMPQPFQGRNSRS